MTVRMNVKYSMHLCMQKQHNVHNRALTCYCMLVSIRMVMSTRAQDVTMYSLLLIVATDAPSLHVDTGDVLPG